MAHRRCEASAGAMVCSGWLFTRFSLHVRNRSTNIRPTSPKHPARFRQCCTHNSAESVFRRCRSPVPPCRSPMPEHADHPGVERRSIGALGSGYGVEVWGSRESSSNGGLLSLCVGGDSRWAGFSGGLEAGRRPTGGCPRRTGGRCRAALRAAPRSAPTCGHPRRSSRTEVPSRLGRHWATRPARCRARSSFSSIKRNTTSASILSWAECSARTRMATTGEPSSPPSYLPGPANPSTNRIRAFLLPIPRIGNQAFR